MVIDMDKGEFIHVLRDMVSKERLHNNREDIITIVDTYNNNNIHDHMLCVDVAGIIVNEIEEEWEVPLEDI